MISILSSTPKFPKIKQDIVAKSEVQFEAIYCNPTVMKFLLNEMKIFILESFFR